MKNEIAMFITPKNEIVPGEIVEITCDNQVQRIHSVLGIQFVNGLSSIQIIVDLEIYDNPVNFPFSEGLLLFGHKKTEFPSQADLHLKSWSKSEKRKRMLKPNDTPCIYYPNLEPDAMKFDTFEYEEYYMTQMTFLVEPDSMKKATVKNALRWAGFLYGLDHGQYKRRKYCLI